jgi:hypothetical protein
MAFRQWPWGGARFTLACEGGQIDEWVYRRIIEEEIPIRRGREVASLPLAAPASARRSSFRACIGSSRACRGDPLFGRPTVSCSIRSMSACGKTRRPTRCGTKRPLQAGQASGGGLEERMAETHKPNTLARVEIRRAPPYILIQRGPRRPSKRRPAHTGEKATRFPLPRGHPLRAKSPAQIPLGRRHLGAESRSRECPRRAFLTPVKKFFMGALENRSRPSAGGSTQFGQALLPKSSPALRAKSVAPRVAAAHRTRASYR